MFSALLDFITQTFLDKNGKPHGREITVFIFVLMVVISFGAWLFFDKVLPEFMLLAFTGVIAAGLGFSSYNNDHTTNI
jgi:hypothetical protein